jgi:serine/threonine-protein kinase
MSSGKIQREAIQQELARVLASSCFAKSDRLSRFLRFVVEQSVAGRTDELKESLIAIEVFGRQPDYDPKLDSIVRTEAGRLRARLTEYYAGEGSGDLLTIELPKGGYTPVFRTPAKQTKSKQVWLRLTLLGALLILTTAAAGHWWLAHSSEPITIAVLPLENLGGDPTNNDFADGLTDEIITNLSAIEGLAVRSRTSSFDFRGKAHNVHEAGRQLGVDYLLEGSVLRGGGKLRINTQLVRVRDDFALWSREFDREATDVFAIQDEIARAIVNTLRLNLGRGRRRYETSVEAYDLYLHARALGAQRGVGGVVQSVPLFEQVVAMDPGFTPAQAGLASAYAVRSSLFGRDHPADELEKMQSAAERAFELDPFLAETHDALGMVYARRGQWEESEKSFRHALDLDANRSTTSQRYATWLLLALGRVQEALQQLRAAEKADPRSPEVRGALAMVLISAGQFDEADKYCAMLGAENSMRLQLLGRARLGQGKYEEAVQILSEEAGRNTGFLGNAYARSGNRAKAEELAAATDRPNAQALIYAGLGDKDRTFAALENMAPEGAQRIGQYLTYPELALVRGDPRLKAFRKKIGLPD